MTSNCDDPKERRKKKVNGYGIPIIHQRHQQQQHFFIALALFCDKNGE